MVEVDETTTRFTAQDKKLVRFACDKIESHWGICSASVSFSAWLTVRFIFS